MNNSSPIPCRWCEEPLVFVETPNRRRLPVEADTLGHYQVVLKGGTGPQIRVVMEDGTVVDGREPLQDVPEPRPTDVYGYLPHWGNCPGANEARKK